MPIHKAGLKLAVAAACISAPVIGWIQHVHGVKLATANLEKAEEWQKGTLNKVEQWYADTMYHLQYGNYLRYNHFSVPSPETAERLLRFEEWLAKEKRAEMDPVPEEEEEEEEEGRAQQDTEWEMERYEKWCETWKQFSARWDTTDPLVW